MESKAEGSTRPVNVAKFMTGQDGKLVAFGELSAEQLAVIQDPLQSDKLSILYKSKDEKKQDDTKYLDSSISCARNTLQVAPTDHLAYKKWQWRLANYLTARFHRKEDRAALEEAGLYCEAALAIKRGDTSNDDEEELELPESSMANISINGNLIDSARCKALGNLSQHYKILYEINGNEADFEKANNIHKELDQFVHKHNIQRRFFAATRIKIFLYMAKFDKTVDLASIEEAATLAHDAAKLIDNPQEYHQAQTLLGDVYEKMYQAKEENQVLRDAIHHYNQSYMLEGSIQLYSVEKLCRLYLKLALLEQDRFLGREASSHACMLLLCTQPNQFNYQQYKTLQEECFAKLGEEIGLIWYWVPTNADIIAKERQILKAYADGGDLGELYYELACLRGDRFLTHNGDQFEELTEAAAAVDSSIKHTSVHDAKNLAARLCYVATIYTQMHEETELNKYADKAVEYLRQAHEKTKLATDLDAGFKASVAYKLANAVYDKLDEDGWDDIPFDKEAAEAGVAAFDYAVNIMADNCSGDDDCGYCENAKIYSEDIEKYKKRIVELEEEKAKTLQRKEQSRIKDAEEKKEAELKNLAEKGKQDSNDQQ